VSMRSSFEESDAPSTRTTQFYSMLGSRAIWHDGWKAVTNHPTIAGWSHFNDDEWELYHTQVDRAELHNVAKENRDKVRELWRGALKEWFPEGKKDPGLALLKVTIDKAEYWDASENRMVDLAPATRPVRPEMRGPGRRPDPPESPAPGGAQG